MNCLLLMYLTQELAELKLVLKCLDSSEPTLQLRRKFVERYLSLNLILSLQVTD